MINHVRVHFNANSIEEIHQPNALDHLATALMFQAIFSPEINRAFSQFNQSLIIGLGIQLHKRHNHRPHEITNLQGAFATDQH